MLVLESAKVAVGNTARTAGGTDGCGAIRLEKPYTPQHTLLRSGMPLLFAPACEVMLAFRSIGISGDLVPADTFLLLNKL